MPKTKTIALTLMSALAALAIFALPAQAAQQIEEFTTTASTSLAGGHPDLTTSFKLKDAGAPEVAKNITFNTPEGIFGNPSVLIQCRAVDFSLNACPPASQAGLITIHADYEGDPDHLLGTAPIYSLEAGPEETARFAFVAPQLNIPIAIPVTTRSASDYGLRFTVSGITQLAPLSAADITFWGFPAAGAHDAQRFPKGSPGSPAGCRRIGRSGHLDVLDRRTVAARPGPLGGLGRLPGPPGRRRSARRTRRWAGSWPPYRYR